MYSASGSSDINESRLIIIICIQPIPALKTFKTYNGEQKTIKHVIGKLRFYCYQGFIVLK